MQVLAVSNIKGGVGKTTAAVNLAYLSAADGVPTALWDLDPQGAATWLLGAEAGAAASARKLVSGRRDLPELLLPTEYPGLDLLPADFSYRNFDIHLAARNKPTARLLKLARPLSATHGRLILDCPPGISLLSENALRAADAVLVPLVPAPLSIRMLEQLYAFVASEGWTDLALLPFFSMVDRRKTLHVESMDAARVRFPDLLATEVPCWSAIERMTLRRAPLPAYAPGSEATTIYHDLWREVLGRLPQPAALQPAAPQQAAPP